MRLHPSVVEKVLYWCTNYGGHKDETRLVGMVNSLRVTPYLRTQTESALSMVLVDTQQLVTERIQRGQSIVEVVPMQLHPSASGKIMELYGMYSGHTNETKLRRAIQALDFTPYERRVNEKKDTVLVLTSDYMKTLSGTAQK